MGGFQAAVLGAILGVAASIFPAILFERALRGSRDTSVAIGLLSILGSFAVLTCSVLVVWAVSRSDLLAFGCAEVVSFMLLWAVEAGRAWKEAQRQQQRQLDLKREQELEGKPKP